MKKNEFPIFNLLGLLGSALWATTIFLRKAEMALSGSARFLMGIAPNFAVGLLIPALVVIGYPSLFRKDLTFRTFVLLLLGSYTLIFTSEVIHDIFLSSRFDPLDMSASLVGFIIMVAAFRAKKTVLA